jgi:hypothetical protein
MKDSCPSCGSSLLSQCIWDHFLEVMGDDKEADRVSSMYGATRNNGLRWDISVPVYAEKSDEVIGWECPSCGHSWPK